MGDLLRMRGEAKTAMERYTQALHVAERLSTIDPGTTKYQHDLGVCLDRVGGLLAARGQEDNPTRRQ